MFSVDCAVEPQLSWTNPNGQYWPFPSSKSSVPASRNDCTAQQHEPIWRKQKTHDVIESEFAKPEKKKKRRKADKERKVNWREEAKKIKKSIYIYIYIYRPDRRRRRALSFSSGSYTLNGPLFQPLPPTLSKHGCGQTYNVLYSNLQVHLDSCCSGTC